MTFEIQKHNFTLSVFQNQRIRNTEAIARTPSDYQLVGATADIGIFQSRNGSFGIGVGDFSSTTTLTRVSDLLDVPISTWWKVLFGGLTGVSDMLDVPITRIEWFYSGLRLQSMSAEVPIPMGAFFSRDAFLLVLEGDDYFAGSPDSPQGEEIQGMAGNDRFKGYSDDGSGSNHSASFKGDYFYGGEGIDTSIYQGKISEYTITPTSAKGEVGIYDHRVDDGTRIAGFYVDDSVATRDGSDRLAEVERLEFEVAEDNGANRIALDIAGHAGTAAKIVGALWGKEALDNPQLIGILLHGLDSGFTYDEVLDFALGASLGPNKTNDAVAELVYLNLIGEAPTEAMTKELASFMDSGAYTQAAFTRVVADLEINATNIDLVGLANTGLQYVEYVA